MQAPNGILGEAVGKMYVEKYFPESSKERMVDLVHRLQDALAQRIDESTWMSQETKEKAKDKLRLLPALNIPMEQLQKAVAVIKECCAE